MGALSNSVNVLNQNVTFLQNFAYAILKKGLISDAEIKAAVDEANQKLADAKRIRPEEAGTDGGDSGGSGGESSNTANTSGDTVAGSTEGTNSGPGESNQGDQSTGTG